MADNAQDPLEIFPIEIWECILEKLRTQGSSRDVLNCSKVCTEFQRILEPTKQEWLFGSICPFILPYLKGGELLACRKVCRNWRRCIENFLEDFETWQPFNEVISDISRSTQYDPLRQKGIKWTKIKNERAVEIFLDAMKKQEMKTPFVGRSLSLDELDGYRKKSEFFERALEVFSLYGDHIWHLRVAPMYDSYDTYQFYRGLKQILCHTPNLKSLTLHSCEFNDSYGDDKSRFKNLLDDNPMPEILSVETLELQAYIRSPVFFLEELISKINFANLKCLKLHHYYDYNAQSTAVVKLKEPLPLLNELHVSEIRGDEVNHLEYILNNMISPTAPLAKLCLSFWGFVKEIDFDRVCKVISRWKGTLRMLAVKMSAEIPYYFVSNNRVQDPGPSVSKLDAPNLKNLEVEGIIFGTGLLPPALNASLEYLHIRYNDYMLDAGMEFYKCVFDAGELHNSSIWGEMKKLKVIRVQRGCRENVACSREMHERGIQPKLYISELYYEW